MHGIHTALVTPFDADGGVDLPVFRDLCRRQLDAGIHGLVPCGTTGETPTLSGDEKDHLLTATLEVARGRVPVTMGVGTNATASTLANIRRARELGADAGLLVFPYYNKPNPEGLRRHVELAAAEGLPLVLYHVPGRTGQRLPVDELATLASLEGVVAVKEATGDLRYGGDLVVRTETAILSGDDFTFLPLLAAGGAGCISVLSNVAPAQTVRILEDWRAGRNEAATAGVKRLWPVIEGLFADSNPVPCKAMMASMGLCSAEVRLPLAPWSGPSFADLLAAIGPA